jgi:uncharacterized integral membrane protein (TIGR00698 family)
MGEKASVLGTATGTEPVAVPSSGPIRAFLPGIAAAAAIAVFATALGHIVPVVGAPVVAIVAGLLVAAFRRPPARLGPGLAFTSRTVLQGSIIVLGLELSFHQVLSANERSLPVLAGTLLAALAMASVAGRALRVRPDVTTLVGVGTAICGASAIAATDSVLDADSADVSYAVATIFCFNLVAVVSFPPVGHLLGLSQHSFGLWAGTAVNDTSSVVAASNAYGHAATSYGVVVKLTRTLAIIPVTLAIALWRNRRNAVQKVHGSGSARPAALSLRRIFPLFIIAFAGAVLADTLGLVPASWHGGLSEAATWMITAALAAIGLSTDLGHVRRAGVRPLALGALLWLTVGLTSLLLQAATGTL